MSGASRKGKPKDSPRESVRTMTMTDPLVTVTTRNSKEKRREAKYKFEKPNLKDQFERPNIKFERRQI
jgi:hypothetical protein